MISVDVPMACDKGNYMIQDCAASDVVTSYSMGDYLLKLAHETAWRYFKGFSSGPCDWEDLVQVAAMRGLKEYSRFDASRGIKLRTYLSRHMVGEMRDELRRTVRRRSGRKLSGLQIAAASLSKAAERCRDREAVDHYCIGLSPEYALVIRMYFIDGLFMREIGQAIGYSESRVGQIIGDSLGIIKSRASRV